MTLAGTGGEQMQTVTEPKVPFLGEPLCLYIDGRFVETEAALPTLNPATGEMLAEAPLATPREVSLAVEAAERAFEAWRTFPPTQRARLIWRLADLLEENEEELATIEVLDNGKPLGEAQAVDIALTIELLRYYAGWATKVSGGVLPNSIPGMMTLNKREPVGVVAAITPWNFPLLEVAYKLGPGLAAGCTFVIKPSELAPLSTIRLMQLVEEADSAGCREPRDRGPDVGAELIGHPASPRSPSRARRRPAREILRASIDGLKGSPLSSAGRARTSSSRTPISTRRPAESSAASSSTKDRRASPARACWSRRRSPTSSSSASWTRLATSASGMVSIRRPRWGR
jgi:hypothetical protein